MLEPKPPNGWLERQSTQWRNGEVHTEEYDTISDVLVLIAYLQKLGHKHRRLLAFRRSGRSVTFKFYPSRADEFREARRAAWGHELEEPWDSTHKRAHQEIPI
jgi:hypothetical protein